jgi:class 3 adenylate cyclase
VRAAIAMRRVAGDLHLHTRAGIHSGEVQVTADDLRGIAVHTAARIMALAGPDEILVSATVMDLVDGSDLEFEDAGVHELKGFRGARQLFRLVEGDAGTA